MTTLKEFWNNLIKEENIALFSHMRPDGDTVGSTIGLYLALKSAGKNVDVFCSDFIPDKFNYLPEIKDYKNLVEKSYGAFVAVDCADISRLGDLSEVFNKQKNTFNIDHHVSNTKYAKYNYVCNLSSNCENVFDLLTENGVTISKDTANALATGVITDTGNFQHKNVTANTFITASKLFECGADFNLIIYKNFTEQTKERAKLFSLATAKIRYMFNGRFGIIPVFGEDLKTSNAKLEETEGFIDFLMGVKGVEVGVAIMEIAPNKYKLSFRSKKIDVNEIAGLYGGGGHVLASGCQLSGDFEEIVDKISYAVKQRLPE